MPAANDALSFLAACTLKALVLLAVAFAAAPLLRARSAALRHALWASALAAVLALPLLSALAPRIHVALPTRVVESRDTRPPAVLSDGSPRVFAVSPGSIDRSAPVTARGIATRPRPVLPWRQALLMAWALGFAGALGRLAVHLVRLRNAAGRARPVEDGEWLRLMDDARTEAGVRRRVRLLRGDAVGVPITWGVLRPVLMLPAGCDAWADDRRRAVLAHELAHVRRLDALTLWTARVTTAAYWFLPPTWAAARRMADEGERACDDAVLRTGALPSAYAAHLLEIARGAGHGPRAAAALAMAGSRVERRLVAILDPRHRRSGVGRAGWMGSGFAALVVALPVAGLTAAGVQRAPTDASMRSGPGPGSASRAAAAHALSAPSRSPSLAAGTAPVAASQGAFILPTRGPHPMESSPAGAGARGDASPGAMRDRAERAAQSMPTDSAVSFSDGHLDRLGSVFNLRGNRVVLAAGGQRIAVLRPGGWVQLTQTGTAGERTLVVLPGVDGRPEYTYRVNGFPASFDDDARAWLAGELSRVRTTAP